MSKPKKMAKSWLAASETYGLSARHLDMARELGMNPNKFAKLAARNEPVAAYIETAYREKFGRERPATGSKGNG